MARTNLREDFLLAALKCFHAKGFKGTSIEDIAEAAGAFKGSFYNHFASKEALAVEVVARYESIVTASVSLEGPPAAYLRLKNHFEHLASRSREVDYKHGCLMSNFSVEISQAGEPLRVAVEQAFERWYAAVALVVQQAQEEGDIDKGHDPQQFSRFLVNSWEGATNYTKVVRNDSPLNDFFAFTFPKPSASKKKTEKN